MMTSVTVVPSSAALRTAGAHISSGTRTDLFGVAGWFGILAPFPRVPLHPTSRDQDYRFVPSVVTSRSTEAVTASMFRNRRCWSMMYDRI